MAIRAIGAPNAQGKIPVDINGERLNLAPDDLVTLADGTVVTVEEALNDPTIQAQVQRVANDEDKARLANEATGSAGQPAPVGDQPGSTIPATGGEAAPLPQSSPSPAPASGTATSDTADADAPTEEQDDFRTVPPNAKVWHIDGKIYLAWEIIDPSTGEVVGAVGFHVTDGERWEEILGDLTQTFDFDGTLAEAEALGFIDGGTEQELADFGGEDPLETFYEDYEEQFALSPIYGDPEVLGLLINATLEGRDITDAELAGTDYWRDRTEAQRAWDELVLKDPATAAQRQRANRDQVRLQLQQLGYLDTPESLVSYLADNFTTGQWTSEQLQMQLMAEVDPYSANASPFAGIYDWSALGDFQVVTDGEDYWVRTANGDYRLDGPGQVARFADQAVEMQVKPEGARYVTEGGQHFLILADGTVLHATGPGQIAGLQELYGNPEQFNPEHYQRDTDLMSSVTGTVVDYFGGGGGIESVGEINEVGTAGDLVELVGGAQLSTTQLGREEEVRELLRQYLGPYHAANYTDEWVAEWAGRLRNEAPGTRDLLVQELQRAFASLYPGYDSNDFYESVAAPMRGLWSQYSGGVPNEESVDFQSFLQLGPDAANREGWLRQHGLANQWAPVAQQALNSLTQAFGPQVRRDLAQGVY